MRQICLLTIGDRPKPGRCHLSRWFSQLVHIPCAWQEGYSAKTYGSAFQTGFPGTSGFREWLPGFPPEGTENAWDKIRNTVLCGCSNFTVSQYPCHYESHWKLCLSILNCSSLVLRNPMP